METLYVRALLQWPLSLAAVTLFGTTSFAIVIRGFEGVSAESFAAAMLPAWRAMTIAVAVFAPLMVLAVTAEMARTSWPDAIPLVPAVMSQTHAGHVCCGVTPIIVALPLAGFVQMNSVARMTALSLLALALIFLVAMMSHAIDKGVLAVAIYFIHEAAAGLWIGALGAFWIVTNRAGPPKSWIARAGRAVSSIAAWSVGAIVLSGFYTAYLGIGFDLDRLLYSSYGRTLILKIVAFCVVLSIGAYNRERLVPEIANAGMERILMRNVAVESLLLGLVVMALAALLANTPPAAGHMMMPSGLAM